MLRIIDNKRIELTDSEFKLYQEICRAYDGPKFKGEELFKDLFETDQSGIITFLRPPNRSFTSMEVYMYIVGVMTHQMLRLGYTKVNTFIKDGQETLNQLKMANDKIVELEKKVNQLDTIVGNLSTNVNIPFGD